MGLREFVVQVINVSSCKLWTGARGHPAGLPVTESTAQLLRTYQKL